MIGRARPRPALEGRRAHGRQCLSVYRPAWTLPSARGRFWFLKNVDRRESRDESGQPPLQHAPPAAHQQIRKFSF